MEGKGKRLHYTKGRFQKFMLGKLVDFSLKCVASLLRKMMEGLKVSESIFKLFEALPSVEVVH